MARRRKGEVLPAVFGISTGFIEGSNLRDKRLVKTEDGIVFLNEW
jgi:hypothetical protein